MESLLGDQTHTTNSVVYQVFRNDNWETTLAQFKEFVNVTVLPKQFKLLDAGLVTTAAPSSEAIMYCLYDPREIDPSQQKVLDVSFYCKEEPWKATFDWLESEVNKHGSNFFRHDFTPMKGDSHSNVAAVFHWAEHSPTPKRFGLLNVTAYSWNETLYNTKRAWLEKCQRCDPVDVKFNTGAFDEDIQLTIVYVPDQPHDFDFTITKDYCYDSFKANFEEICNRISRRPRLFLSSAISTRGGTDGEYQVYAVMYKHPHSYLHIEGGPEFRWQLLNRWEEVVATQKQKVQYFEGTTVEGLAAGAELDDRKATEIANAFHSYCEQKDKYVDLALSKEFWKSREVRELEITVDKQTSALSLWQLQWVANVKEGKIVCSFGFIRQTPSRQTPSLF